MLAVQALCAYDAIGDVFGAQVHTFLRDSHTYADLGWSQPPPPDALDFARVLAEETWARRTDIDAVLVRLVPGWSLDRIQPVDRNILRLGLYELRECPQTPPAVVINEAIELARLFGGGDSPAFVNGVLDAARRELEQAVSPAAPDPGPVE